MTQGTKVKNVYGEVAFVIWVEENVVLTTKGHWHITKTFKA